MVATPQDVLKSFDILPESDQRTVAAEIWRRAAHWESPPISDEALVENADALFQQLDRDEEQNGNAGSR